MGRELCRHLQGRRRSIRVDPVRRTPLGVGVRQNERDAAVRETVIGEPVTQLNRTAAVRVTNFGENLQGVHARHWLTRRGTEVGFESPPVAAVRVPIRIECAKGVVR